MTSVYSIVIEFGGALYSNGILNKILNFSQTGKTFRNFPKKSSNVSLTLSLFELKYIFLAPIPFLSSPFISLARAPMVQLCSLHQVIKF